MKNNTFRKRQKINRKEPKEKPVLSILNSPAIAADVSSDLT